jgi:hypothetical protein
MAIGCGLDGRNSIPAQWKLFSLHHSVLTVSGFHPAFYSVCTKDSFSGGKAAEASNLRLTYI